MRKQIYQYQNRIIDFKFEINENRILRNENEISLITNIIQNKPNNEKTRQENK